MDCPKLYRKRLIPAECVALTKDSVLEYDADILITSWNTIRPKNDLHHGISCFYLKKGWKISYFFKEDDELMYIYCDIISPELNESDNSLVITDLLADVIIYPDGFVKVVDLDELSEALDRDLISADQLKTSLTCLNSLLELIYKGKLESLTAPLNGYAPSASGSVKNMSAYGVFRRNG